MAPTTQRTARTPDGRTLAIEEARLLDHDGHLTLLTNRMGEVHAWLGERL